MKKEPINIKEKTECTGCRACEQLCPKKAIKMQEDSEGFLYPEIDETLCIHCGLCRIRCPQIKRMHRKTETKVYAVKPKDIDIAKKSTSAGMAYVLSKKIIQEKGMVFGCAYSDNLEPVQMGVKEEKQLEKLRGSKYVASNTKNTYTEAKKALEEGKQVLYIGTACQIGGLYAFLGKKYATLWTIDIVCHGTPSYKLFRKYIEYLEQVYQAKVTHYDFRNKDKAIWGEFYAKATLENGENKYIYADLDPYYAHFLRGTTYRESCYACLYANTDRVGDITLADFWGIEKENPTFFSQAGVSLVMINTEKGREMLESIREEIEWSEHTEEQAIRKNANLSAPTKRPEERNTIYHDIDTKCSNEFVAQNLYIKGKWKKQIKRYIPHQVKQVLKRFL